MAAVALAISCRCDEIAAAGAASPSPEAQAMWAPALEVLAEALPGTTFDTWLKDTEGLRCDGDNLVVRVPSVFAVVVAGADGCIRRFCGPCGVALATSGTSGSRLPRRLCVRSTAFHLVTVGDTPDGN